MFRHLRLPTLLCFAALTGSPSVVAAQSQCTLPVAAFLTDGAGAPIVGEMDVELRFYTDGSPDALPVECRSTSATLEDGWLRLLVDACAAPAPDDCGVVSLRAVLDIADSVWIGVRINDDDAELAPRQLIGAVPYAIRAASASRADNADLLDGHSADEFASAAVLDAHLAAGHGDTLGVPTLTTITTSGEACALVDGTPICWPYTDFFPFGARYDAIDVSGHGACGIDTEGALECSDLTFAGTSGIDELVPAGVFTEVSVGEGACALSSAGEVVCWGGLADLSADAPAGEFQALDIGNGGGRTACAAGALGGIVCWGGEGSSGGTEIIAEAPTTGLYSEVSVGDFFACALDAVENDVECWGPSPPTPTGTFLAISGGGHAGCGLTTDRGIDCWVNTLASWTWDAARVPSGTGFVQVSAHEGLGCAIHEGGAVYCWSTRGQTPLNTQVPFGLRYR